MATFPDKIKVFLASPMPRKIVTFGMVGVANVMVDFAIFALAYNVLGLSLIPANVLAWIIAVTGSYVMNSMFTFRVESGRQLRLKDYARFVVSGILGVVVGTTILVVLSKFMPVYAAKLASILAGFAVNFTMSNFVVFRKR